MNTTTAAQSTTVTLTDGRFISVEATNDHDWYIIMNVNGEKHGICCMNASTLESAVAEASRIARGIEFDIRWMAR